MPRVKEPKWPTERPQRRAHSKQRIMQCSTVQYNDRIRHTNDSSGSNSSSSRAIHNTVWTGGVSAWLRLMFRLPLSQPLRASLHIVVHLLH